jgi:hypothetical protein
MLDFLPVETRNDWSPCFKFEYLFGEIDLLEKNMKLVKRQLGTWDSSKNFFFQIAYDGTALAKGGSHISFLNMILLSTQQTGYSIHEQAEF